MFFVAASTLILLLIKNNPTYMFFWQLYKTLERKVLLKLAFVSNYLNHHQVCLCNQFYNRCEEFYFIATEKISLERLEMGYEEINSKYPYVIKMYEAASYRKTAYKIIATFDVVIFGACPTKLIELRMKQRNLVLYTWNGF